MMMNMKFLWLLVILPSSSVLSLTTMSTPADMSRREGLTTIVSGFLGVSVGIVASPNAAEARYVLDDETGDYVEVEDSDWQTEWQSRLKKAQSMSQEEIFEAARGAGNVAEGIEETPKQRQRRAFSACRNPTLREQAGLGSKSSEKDCTVRLLDGDEELMAKLLSR